MASGAVCSVEECDREVLSRGYCGMHYQRWSKYGDPLVSNPGKRKASESACVLCDRPAFSRGWCVAHYQRWRKHGDPTVCLKPMDTDPMQRFLGHVDRSGDCWVWTGWTESTGYGRFSVGQARFGAHRWAYEALVDPIPEGMELDHECHNRDRSCPGGDSCLHRRCVNPAHLAPKPPRANTLLSGNPAARNARKAHCHRGHEFSPENTRVNPDGSRDCRACARETQRDYTARRKASAG